MLVQSFSMATKFGEEEVELELCLSLGGPFKKTDKSKPISDIDGGMKKSEIKREAKEQRNGGERESKRIRTECNGVNLDLSFSKMDNGYGSGQVKENSRSVQIGSPVCSSSDVSDPSTSSQQEGGSCENSVQTKPVKSPVNKIGTGTEKSMQSTDGPNDAVVVETQACSRVTSKPPKPRPNGNGANTNLLPFAQMPCVTSTGDGPEGKTVNGFLYRYSKSEVSIICVCHGTSFSPAEFIIHAGGTNVSHPLRHITVVPSTF